MQPIDTEMWKAKDVARLLSLVEADRRYFQELVAALPAPFAVVASDLSMSSGNRAFRELFGGRNVDVAGALEQLMPAPEVLAAVRGAMGGKSAKAQATVEGRRYEVAVHPIRHWDEDEVLLCLSPVAEPEKHTTPSPLAAALWTVDAATMRFTAVEWGQLPAKEWAVGGDFWARAIDAADLPAVREFYAAVCAGKPLSSCDYRSANLWLRDTVRVEASADGKVARIHGISLDITEARRAEGQRHQAQRLDAVARLANRVAHDCNNLMMILGGYGEDLLHALPPESSLRVNAQEILTAGDRVAALASQLNALTKRSPVNVSNFGLDSFLSGLKPGLERLVPAGVTLAVSGGTGDVVVATDSEQLAMAIHTLVQRACAGMPNGGPVSVQGGLAAVGHVGAALPAGQYAQIEVRDSGLAVHPEALARLFEPDASTDPIRQKLPPLYQSLRAIGCDVEATSVSPHGTCFRIAVPLGSAEKKASVLPPAFLEALAKPPAKPEVKPEPKPEPPKPEPPKPKSKPAPEPEPPRPVIKTKPVEPEPPKPVAPPPAPPEPERAKPVVLVVDDEAGIRSLLRKVLLREGFHVLEATQGKEGLDVAAAHKGRIDLLLTDVVMPEMGGIELAQKLHAARPGIKILMISGYMGAKGVETENLPKGTLFLQKPFTLNSLLDKVREALGAPTGRSAGA
jgi:CheY-like chemotaxis protein/PAS domain-containing protein